MFLVILDLSASIVFIALKKLTGLRQSDPEMREKHPRKGIGVEKDAIRTILPESKVIIKERLQDRISREFP